MGHLGSKGNTECQGVSLDSTCTAIREEKISAPPQEGWKEKAGWADHGVPSPRLSHGTSSSLLTALAPGLHVLPASSCHSSCCSQGLQCSCGKNKNGGSGIGSKAWQSCSPRPLCAPCWPLHPLSPAMLWANPESPSVSSEPHSPLTPSVPSDPSHPLRPASPLRLCHFPVTSVPPWPSDAPQPQPQQHLKVTVPSVSPLLSPLSPLSLTVPQQLLRGQCLGPAAAPTAPGTPGAGTAAPPGLAASSDQHSKRGQRGHKGKQEMEKASEEGKSLKIQPRPTQLNLCI